MEHSIACILYEAFRSQIIKLVIRLQILSAEYALLKKLDYDIWPVTAKNMVEIYLFFVTQPDRVDMANQVGHRQCYSEFAQDGARLPSSSYLHPDYERRRERNANNLKQISMVCDDLLFLNIRGNGHHTRISVLIVFLLWFSI